MSKDYEVGYGKPPERTRFKAGQSGNLKGRPKGRKNMATFMQEVLERRVLIKQNGQQRRVSFAEAFVHRLVVRAIEGTTRDMISLMKAMHDYLPEAFEVDKLPQTIRVEFVGSDGKEWRPDNRLSEDG